MSRRRPAGRHRRAFRGARTRILASYLVLLALSTLVSVLASRQILLSRTGERVDAALVQEAEEFGRLVRDGRDPRTGNPFGGDIASIFDVYLSRNVPGEGEQFLTLLDGEPYRATSPDSRVVRTLVERLGGVSREPRAVRGELEVDGATLRYLAVPVRVEGRPRGVFAVAENLSREREEVVDAVQVAAGVSTGVLLVASILAFLVAGRVLAPLRDLDRTARSITDTDLSRRIEAEGDDELAELARTFNSMLDRLEQAFTTQKDFISDAGHELRTPITIIRGHLELMDGEDPDERRETVDLVCDELDRMSRFVDDLLLLAKARQPDFLRLEPLDLDAVAGELHTKAQALAPRDWRLDADRANGRVVADRQRLTQAVMNLATNAARHTEPDTPIELGAALANGEARLWVSDRGPGIAPAERERIFERFVQSGNARRRSDGAGLGLAIVRAVAEAHGGRVEVESAEGLGSRFTVIIPADPEEAGDQPDAARTEASAQR